MQRRGKYKEGQDTKNAMWEGAEKFIKGEYILKKMG